MGGKLKAKTARESGDSDKPFKKTTSATPVTKKKGVEWCRGLQRREVGQKALNIRAEWLCDILKASGNLTKCFSFANCRVRR